MAITLDFESNNPGSTPGRTFFLSCLAFFFVCLLRKTSRIITNTKKIRALDTRHKYTQKKKLLPA